MKSSAGQTCIVEVTSLKQMSELFDAPPWGWSTLPRLELRIPGVHRELQDRTERQLNRLRDVCGCQAAALFMIGALALYTFGDGLIAGLPRTVLTGLGIAIGVALFGKLTVLAFARIAYGLAVGAFLRAARHANE